VIGGTSFLKLYPIDEQNIELIRRQFDEKTSHQANSPKYYEHYIYYRKILHRGLLHKIKSIKEHRNKKKNE